MTFDARRMKRWNKATGRYERFTPGERQYPTVPPKLVPQLEAIAPSEDNGMTYRPCRVVLDDGTAVDCAFLVDAQQYIRAWGVWPDQDEGKREVSISDVTQIESSPFRLPAELAMRLYDAGESGMGYMLFEIRYRDGSRSSHISGNAVDFVNLAPGKNMHDVEEVIPHAGRDTRPQLDAPEYSWCLYSNG